MRHKTSPCALPPTRARSHQVVLEKRHGAAANPRPHLPLRVPSASDRSGSARAFSASWSPDPHGHPCREGGLLRVFRLRSQDDASFEVPAAERRMNDSNASRSWGPFRITLRVCASRKRSSSGVRSLEAVHDRHHQVEQNHVRRRAVEQVQTLPAVLGLVSGIWYLVFQHPGSEPHPREDGEVVDSHVEFGADVRIIFLVLEALPIDTDV